MKRVKNKPKRVQRAAAAVPVQPLESQPKDSLRAGRAQLWIGLQLEVGS